MENSRILWIQIILLPKGKRAETPGGKNYMNLSWLKYEAK